MKSRRTLAREYEKLNKEYLACLGREAELSYVLKEVKEEAEFMRRQDAEIKELHQNVRQLKHDMKNHFMVVASFLNEENIEQAKDYISEILGKLNAMHSYVETGNSLLNHILNEKLEAAKSQGISIKAEIENLAFASMKSIDFSALLTNMLDNAIEGSKKADNPEIHIVIQQNRGYESICVKNRIQRSVLEHNPNLESTKEQKEEHGMGVGKIKEITEEYGGMCDIYEEEYFFCVKVLLPVFIPQ